MSRKPNATGKPAAKVERERRLAEALRANLKRRKAAARPDTPEAKPPPKPRPGDVRISVSGAEGGTPSGLRRPSKGAPPCHSKLRQSEVYRWRSSS